MNRPSFVLIAVLAASSVSAAPPAAPPAANPSLMGSSARSWEEIQAGVGKGNAKPVFRAPTATLDELEMHVTHLPVGKAAHPPHKHPEEEVMIIREGTVEAMVGSETRRLGPGSVIFQAANQMHTLRNVGDVTAVYHVMKWASPGTRKAAAPAKP